MIVKICLVVLLFAYMSRDVYGKDDAPSLSSYLDPQNEKVIQKQFPLSAYSNEVRKPCKFKTGSQDKEWMNMYKRRLLLPSPSKGRYPFNTDLVPQSLRDGDYQDSVNDEFRRPSNDPDLRYASKQLPNILIDKNDDSSSEYHDSEQRIANHIVSSLCNNDINKLDVPDAEHNVDRKTLNNKSLLEANINGSYNPQDSKSAKTDKLPLSPKETQTLKKCVTVSTKLSEENSKFKQYRRLLPTEDNAQSVYFSQQNSNEVLDNNERMNDEPHHSSNSRDYTSDLRKTDDNDDIPDPTKGAGISRLSDTKMLLTGSSRVCYACTSASDPSCLVPDRRTTVKYCRKGHNACLTKTFKTESSTVLIRDCTSTCDATEAHGITPKYKSCVICHSDLCNDTNGAFSIHSHSLIVFLVVMSFIRITF